MKFSIKAVNIGGDVVFHDRFYTANSLQSKVSYRLITESIFAILSCTRSTNLTSEVCSLISGISIFVNLKKPVIFHVPLSALDEYERNVFLYCIPSQRKSIEYGESALLKRIYASSLSEYIPGFMYRVIPALPLRFTKKFLMGAHLFGKKGLPLMWSFPQLHLKE